MIQREICLVMTNHGRERQSNPMACVRVGSSLNGGRVAGADIPKQVEDEYYRPVTVVHDWDIGDDNGRVILRFGMLRCAISAIEFTLAMQEPKPLLELQDDDAAVLAGWYAVAYDLQC